MLNCLRMPMSLLISKYTDYILYARTCINEGAFRKHGVIISCLYDSWFSIFLYYCSESELAVPP